MKKLIIQRDIPAILRTIREDQYPSEEQMSAIHAVLDAFGAPTVVCVGCGAAADPRLTDTAAFCEACYRREHYLAKLAEVGALREMQHPPRPDYEAEGAHLYVPAGEKPAHEFKCGIYFVDHPGVCDLPYGHDGEHRFSTVIK